jgi:hypothetical protein
MTRGQLSITYDIPSMDCRCSSARRPFVRGVTARIACGKHHAPVEVHPQGIQMKKAIAATVFVMLAALAPHAMADEATVYGSSSAVRMLAPYTGLIQAKAGLKVAASPLGTGQLVLDVIDGKASAALVSMPLVDAVAAAREAAWSEGRMLKVPESLQFREVGSLRNGDVPVGFVTVGAPSGALSRVIADLN